MNWNDFSLIDLEVLCSPAILERGRAYLQEGQLVQRCRFRNLLAGKILGTGGVYSARIWIEDESRLGWECGCPYPDFCKHLAALVLGWLESRERFQLLDSFWEDCLTEPVKLREYFEKMIAKAPFDFLAVAENNRPIPPQFVTNRGLLNLTRNLLSYPCLTAADTPKFSARLENCLGLLEERLGSGSRDALTAAAELLAGLINNYLNLPDSVVKLYILKLLSLMKRVPEVFNPEDSRFVGGELLGYYFQPRLWEMSREMRECLAPFFHNDREYIYQSLAAELEKPPENFRLIALYEMVDFLQGSDTGLKELWEAAQAALSAGEAGLLFLIDRSAEAAPDYAFRLAKAGMRKTAPSGRKAFRERLIKLHQAGGELKQAAAHSFIQFSEEPNFEEYQRLKGLLRNFPAEWADYRGRIGRLLDESGFFQLKLRIFFAEGDFQSVRANLDRIISDRILLVDAAAELARSFYPELADIYPAIIKEIIGVEEKETRQVTLRLLAGLKKISRQNGKPEFWEQLRRELIGQYFDDYRFRKRFGAVLAIPARIEESGNV